MRINEPEEAVRAYEQARKLKPDDDSVIKLIGQAMSLTYDYAKAIEYYEQALSKNEKRNDLVVDLGRLYLRINNLDKAEALLAWKKFETDDFSAPNTEMLKNNSQGFLLIAKLLQKK
jgi:tetratricopeptide repeat protein 21B